MKPSNEKSPALAGTGDEAQDKASITHHSSRCPTFPTSANGRAVLGCLLTGSKVDQFSYYQTTGGPLVDFRTRVSELSREHYWPLADEFHNTRDFNGEPRCVKRYWLDRVELLALFDGFPDFKHRCELFSDKFRQEGDT